MEYCKYLKLINGENIIVTTDNDCKQFKQHKTINIVNPVELMVMRVSNGPVIMESMTLQPWIKVATNDVIEVPTESILLITDVKEEAVEQYKLYLVEYEKRQLEKNQIIDDSHDISEEEMDQDFLENMFELMQQEEESEPEIQHEYKRRYKRTIH